ncbi:MAG: M14 family zinc carboxypeptidase [candidate division WOR-3 bacterium]
MKKYIFTLLVSFLFLLGKESLILVPIASRSDLEIFYELDIPIQDVKEGKVFAFADEDKILNLKARGYEVKILIEDYQKELEKILPYYHTYAEVCSIMHSLVQTYPNIARMETLGLSYNGNRIFGVKVSDNPNTDEAEIGMRLIGAHHGNEKISTEVTLAFLRYLLENYATNPQVQYLVNNRQIFIIPILNADGHIANSRYNGNGVDLNRDYGYMWGSAGGSPAPFSQPETKLIRKHTEKNPLSFEYEYHSTASYVNYPWDFHPQDPPDSALIIYISRRYADSTYGSSTTRLTPINGYDWYEVRGSCQDMAFGEFGIFATTIETQQPSAQARIDSICLVNRRALLDILTIGEWGVQGRILDTFSQTPLPALIKIKGPIRWPVYSYLPTGFYHKFIEGGNCTLEVYSPGYEVKKIGVSIPNRTPVNLDIYLKPSSFAEGYGFRVGWVRRTTNDESQITITPHCLGKPDSLFFSLSYSGEIVIELPKGFPVRNLEGNDIKVWEGNDGIPERYNIYCALDLFGTYYSLGQGIGTQEFDLAQAGIDSAYYIKIVDINSGSQSEPYAGFDLDGITYRLPTIGLKNLTNSDHRKKEIFSPTFWSKEIAKSNSLWQIYHSNGTRLNPWTNKIPSGVYFLKDAQGKVRKVIKP